MRPRKSAKSLSVVIPIDVSNNVLYISENNMKKLKVSNGMKIPLEVRPKLTMMCTIRLNKESPITVEISRGLCAMLGLHFGAVISMEVLDQKLHIHLMENAYSNHGMRLLQQELERLTKKTNMIGTARLSPRFNGLSAVQRTLKEIKNALSVFEIAVFYAVDFAVEKVKRSFIRIFI